MRPGLISDEVSPQLAPALRVCEELGIADVELRVVDGRQLVEHDDASLRRIARSLEAGGFRCPVVDTPFLKQPVPEVEWRLLERGLAAAQLLGAGQLRLFAGLRAPDPGAVRGWLLETLQEACERARAGGVQLALEIEHVCNVATAAEARAVLDELPAGALGLVWDPGNEARFRGETPALPGDVGLTDAITHVHVKDERDGEWVPVGSGIADWPAQLRALADAGYDGQLSLETHHALAEGGAEAASRQSMARLRELLAAVQTAA